VRTAAQAACPHCPFCGPCAFSVMAVWPPKR
jgi:hypothetical protein